MHGTCFVPAVRPVKLLDLAFNFNLILLSRNYNVVYFIDDSDIFHVSSYSPNSIARWSIFFGHKHGHVESDRYSQVVSSLLRDLRDLFYLVDGSNLRARLRPHPTLGPQPTESMRHGGGWEEDAATRNILSVVCLLFGGSGLIVCRLSLCTCWLIIVYLFCNWLNICLLHIMFVMYSTSYDLFMYSYLRYCYVHCNPNANIA